jgi:PAS domain S-box-containing protein
LYVDDIEDQIKADMLSTISRIRFGKEGYIWVTRFDGNVLVSSGKLFDGTKKVWEVFNKNIEKTKSVFKDEYKAALTPHGDYIYCSWIKLTDAKKESPKASFVFGIPEWQWSVGAGVYLDDVEKDIAVMHIELNNQLKKKITYFVLIVMGITAFSVFLFNWLNSRLKNDFNLFVSFFNRAAHSDKEIDRESVKFVEHDRIAKYANKMLQDKIHVQQDLLNERERLFVTIRSIGDGVITTDTSGRVSLMNKVAEQLTGWKIAEAEGKPITKVFNIVNAKTRKQVENPVDHVLESGNIIGLANHTLLISKDGAEYQIADSGARRSCGKAKQIYDQYLKRQRMYPLSKPTQMAKKQKLLNSVPALNISLAIKQKKSLGNQSLFSMKKRMWINFRKLSKR